MVDGNDMPGPSPLDLVDNQPEPYKTAIIMAGKDFKVFKDPEQEMPIEKLVRYEL